MRSFARLVRAAFIAIAATAVFACEANADPATRRFREIVGINVKFSQGESPRDLFLLKELGVRWVRDTVDWPSIEPAAGKYVPFPIAFRDRLAFYKANDIGVVFGLWYDNPAAYPNTPDDQTRSTDAAAYGRYAAEVARQLRASGARFAIELYNEPHNSLKDLGGKWNGEPPSPWLDHYVDMVRAAVADAKRVDPNVRLLAGDDMWVLQARFLERGFPRNLDGLTVHPYVRNRPEIAAIEQDTSWAKPFTLVDADASFASAVRRLRSRAADALGRTPAIWITEWGWPIGGDLAGDRKVDEATLAAFLPRAYLAAADAGVETLCWFSLQDSVDGPMGLTTNDGKRRAPFDALRTMVDQLGDCTAVEHVAGADHPTVGVQVYRLRDGERTTLVAWNVDGGSTATLVGAGDARIVDVVGKPVARGETLALSTSPIYISGVAADAHLRPTAEPAVKPTYLFP